MKFKAHWMLEGRQSQVSSTNRGAGLPLRFYQPSLPRHIPMQLLLFAGLLS